MTNALTIYSQMGQMEIAAKSLAASGYFPDAKSQAQALVKVMAGAEMGLPPFAAMSGIHIIKGKPVLGSNLIATLIKNSPDYDYRVTKLDNEGCTIVFFENGQQVGESSFTRQDAKLAGLSGGNWERYFRNMAFARAISNGARWYTPGIFGGSPVYVPGELGDEDIIDGDMVITEMEPEPEPAPTIDYEATVKGTDERIADCRAAIESADNVVNLGWVVSMITTTGIYNHANHVWNAIFSDEDGFDFNGSAVKRDSMQKISRDGALKVFDWAIERKQPPVDELTGELLEDGEGE